MSLLQRVRHLILLIALAILSSCTIYESPDRKTFEREQTPNQELTSTHYKIISCSADSLRSKANYAELIQIEKQYEVWKFQVNNQFFYESDNLKGVYCLYENT